MPTNKTMPTENPSTEPPPPTSDKQDTGPTTTSAEAQARRAHAMEAYARRLEDADAKVSQMVERINGDIRWTYRMMTRMHLISYISGAIALVAGLILVFLFDKPNLYPLGYVCIIGGLITILFLLTRNPIKNAHYLVTNSAKLGFAYSSYMRQMHQMDTAFRRLSENQEEIDLVKLGNIFRMTQDVMEEVMTTISQMLNEIEE